jgi:hypothetical protein
LLKAVWSSPGHSLRSQSLDSCLGSLGDSDRFMVCQVGQHAENHMGDQFVITVEQRFREALEFDAYGIQFLKWMFEWFIRNTTFDFVSLQMYGGFSKIK